MRYASVFILAVGLMFAGCAGRAGLSAAASADDGSALAAPTRLAGTWRGDYWQLGMVLYEDDANCTLRLREDRTFSASCTRSAIGTNNLAKPSTWSGRVLTKGDRIVLQDATGQWPSIVLMRSAKDDRLYGVSIDPRVGATVEMAFERGEGRLGQFRSE